MQKSDIKILIIEDDRSIGLSLSKGLEKSGFSTKLISNPTDAQKLSDIEIYHLAIIDCMLPMINGVDLAAEIYNKTNGEIKIFLMSGIFKDKSFLSQSSKKVPYLHFIQKPFQLEDVINLVSDTFGDMISPDKPQLYQLLHNQNTSKIDAITAINLMGDIHGFDLPLIISTLNSHKATGYLYLKNENSDIPHTEYGKEYITFTNGNICEVFLKDEQSYFGVLLIEKGFTSTDNVNQVLSDKSKKRIGEKLIDASVLSPHAIEIVQIEQMSIRMSKSISNISYKVHFVIEDEEISAVNKISETQLTPHLYDWIATKISLEWLFIFYSSWSEHKILRGTNFSLLNDVKNYPLIQENRKLMEMFEQEHTVDECLERSGVDGSIFYKVLHFLVLKNIFMFSKSVETEVSNEVKVKRLNKILNEFTNKNYLEILGLSTNAKTIEINRSYQELAKVYHPDKSIGQNEDIKELITKIFSLISEAYNVLKNNDTKREYLIELESAKVQDILSSENLFEKGLRELNQSKYKAAQLAFEESLELNSARSDLIIYLNWAKIKNGSSNKDQKIFIKSIYDSLGKVPPEHRHSPPYFFVKGLFYKLTGNQDKSILNFKKASSIDHTFMPAKKELAKFSRPMSEKTNIFDMSVTNAVNSIFKKK
ncbi:MAG: DnaJ domain-containing protein [Bdellovibrionaceae bacterium]|jgi:curved DNA-binding protein CbpA/CheY-like chemotaxis protein|nr:DnaJ domain-containing protein [Pseudobdellovibrionaceae bacterium]